MRKKDKHLSGALPTEPPPELGHGPAAELTAPTYWGDNFVIFFPDMQHSKTQSFFKNGNK